MLLAILLGAIVPTIASGQPGEYGCGTTGNRVGVIEKVALADD